MATDADGLRSGKHGRGGRLDIMIGVADGAAGVALVIESPAMLSGGERLGRGRMALGAGLGNALRAGGRLRVSHRAGVMNAVAIHTLGHPPASSGQQLSMNAIRIFRVLIHARLIVLAHDIGVAVAVCTKLRNALALHAEFETPARVHRNILIALIGVAAMAIGATDRLGEMNVIGELVAHAFHDKVAFKAGIFPGANSACEEGQQRNQQSLYLHRFRSSKVAYTGAAKHSQELFANSSNNSTELTELTKALGD